MSEKGYLLENRNAVASNRLDALNQIFDPWTHAHLDALGLTTGWRCWEVGAGGPGLVRWLADRVGPTGFVLATDLDPRWAAAAVAPQVSVVAHDVTTPPPEGEFDLIHARLVLTHVPDRERALKNLFTALRPGGWLILEEPDPAMLPLACLTGPDEACELANRLRAKFRSMIEARGGEMSLGRRLPGLLGELGLTELGGEAFFTVVHPTLSVLERLTYEQVRQGMVSAGLATDEEIDRHLRNVESGVITPLMAPLFTVWGRKATAS